ncbi:hypothetical protein [Flavobacterium sp. 25HG05S-40]|uniref:hypothetical protein n=1 Tax=Flavobacterium sp. 25HG05S-40 TaxID=3458682 RepID=UPI004043DA81
MKELNEKHVCEKCLAFFKEYPYNASIAAQINWLRSAVPDDIDPSLYECILGLRKIENEVTYNQIVRDYWQDNEPVYTEIKLQKIRDEYFDLAKNYVYYISFPFTEEVIEYKLVSTFTTSPPCYSIPFFEALAEKYKKTALLKLSLGKVEGKVTVVFAIVGSDDSFYDYSQIPPHGIIDTPKQLPF